MPTFDNAKAFAVLAGVAVVGYALWKVLETGKGAVQSVSDTIGNITDSVATTWHGIKGAAAQASLAFAPGEVGPAGGGSRQELQAIPPPNPGADALDTIAPYMLGMNSVTRDNVGVTSGTDDQSAGNAVPQDYSPDAMGLS